MMRWIKIALLFLGGTILLCMLLLAIVLATFDNDDYKRLLTRAIKKYSSYQVIIEGPFSFNLSMEPSLSASTIRLEGVPDKTPPPITHIGKFEIKVALLPLLSRTVLIKHLLIDDATFFWITDEDRLIKTRERSRIKTASDINLPILENVTLRNINVNISDQEMDDQTKIMLSHFNIDDDRDTGTLHIKGNGTVNSENFLIAGQIGTLTEVLDETAPYPVELVLKIANLDFKVSGTIDDPLHDRILDLHVFGEATELASTLNLFYTDFPEIGHLKLEAEVSGNTQVPIVSDLNLTISGGSQFEFVAKGSVDNLLNGEEANMQVSGSSTNKKIIRMFLPEKVPNFNDIKVEGTVRKLRGIYALDNIKASASDGKGFTIETDGNIRLSEPVDLTQVREMDMRFQLSSPSTNALKPFISDLPPDIGAVSIGGRLVGSEGTFQFDELSARISNAQGLKVEISGSVRAVLQETRKTIDTLDLKISAIAPNLKVTERMLGIRLLPELGPVKAEAKISGNSNILSIKDIDATAGKPDHIRMEWQGSGNINLSGEQLFSNVDIMNIVHAKEASELVSLVGGTVQSIGPLMMKWRIVDRKEGLGADKIEIILGNADVFQLKGTGTIDSIMKHNKVSVDGIDAKFTFSAPNSQGVAELFGKELPELGKVGGSFSLSGRMDNFAISNAKLHTTSLNGFEVSAIGGVGQINLKGDEHFKSLDFELTATAPDIKALPELGEFNLPDIGPIQLKANVKERNGKVDVGRFELRTGSKEEATFLMEGEVNQLLILNKDTKQIAIEGKAHLGKTQFKTNIRGSFNNKRPSIDAKISAQIIQLEDLGIYPRVVSEDPAPEKETEPMPVRRLFNDKSLPFDKLKGLDLSLSLDAEKLAGKNYEINNLDIDVSLENGLLQIIPATLSYSSGFVTIIARVDTASAKPEVMLKVSAKDVDTGALLAHLRNPLIIDGHLNLAVDLQSVGESSSELASSLEGGFGIAIEGGKLKGSTSLLVGDTLDLLTTLPKVKDYQDMNCLVLRFNFEDGIGKSEHIFIDIPDASANGVGTVDLVSETIDIALHPKPKKGLTGTNSAIRIRGPLTTKPKVSKLPLKEALKLSGEIFAPYVFLPARGLGYLWYLMKDDTGEQSLCIPEAPEGD